MPICVFTRNTAGIIYTYQTDVSYGLVAPVQPAQAITMRDLLLECADSRRFMSLGDRSEDATVTSVRTGAVGRHKVLAYCFFSPRPFLDESDCTKATQFS
jgi:hypothetical protein